MRWRPQDYVAMVLAILVFLMLLSSTNLSMIVIGKEAFVKWREGIHPELPSFWRDMLNILLGALAGYIAGRGSEK